MLLARAAPLALMIGCQNPDYGLAKALDREKGGYDDVAIHVDVALQRNRFGEATSRCQVEVAFTPLGEDEEAPGAGEPDDAGDVGRPSGPGTCAYTPPPPGPADPAPPPPAGIDTGDDWYVSGSLQGPDHIRLISDRGTDLELRAVEAEDGGVRYEYEGCSAEAFPTRTVFDLVVPHDTDHNGLYGFELAEAFAVGPDVTLLTPDPALSADGGDRVPLPIDEPLDVRWLLDGSAPDVRGEAVPVTVTVQLQHQDSTGETAAAWLVCMPDEAGWMRVEPGDLASFPANGAAGEDRWFTSVAVHTTAESPAIDTPWGQRLQVEAHISEGGMVLLHEP